MPLRMSSPPSALRVVPVPGKTIPRLFTPPLVTGPPGGCPCGCALSPTTSYGFAVIRFAANVLLEPLDPWQKLAVIHAGELQEDGITPRFRYVLILVARQNGKTHLLRVLTLFWLFAEQWPIVLGLNTDRNYALRQLKNVHKTAVGNSVLCGLLPRGRNRGLRGMTGSEAMVTTEDCEYLIAAPNRRAGRSLTVDRVIFDEIREHHNREAWDAATGAMAALAYAQAFCITNQGDDKSVVLDWLHEVAKQSIEDGDTDTDTCLLEWSAPPGADLLDPEAWAQANPNLVHRLPFRALANEAKNVAANPHAVDSNGKTTEASFRTEKLCQRVPKFQGAINPADWKECGVDGDELPTGRPALALDVSPDRQHVTLSAAALMEDGRVRVGVAKAWDGPLALKEVRQQLPGLLKEIKPRSFGYVPGGPAAALIADFTKRPGGWPPTGVTVEEIREEVAGICMGFASLVESKDIVHANNELQDTHVTSAEKLMIGDGRWRFSRKGGHCDAAYAAAVAVYLARTQPKPVGKPRLITV